MLLIAFGAPLRVLGGMLSVSDFILPDEVLLIVFFFFYGVAYISCFWRIETEYLLEQEKPGFVRQQGRYFLKHGLPWQHFGLAGMMLCAIILLLESVVCGTSGTCMSGIRFFQIISYNVTSTISFILSVLLLTISIGIITVLTYKKLSVFVLYLHNRSKIAKIILLFLFVSVAIFLGGAGNVRIVIPTFAVYFSFSMYNWYENVSYSQYMYLPLRKNYKLIIAVWFSYLFDSTASLSLQSVLKATALLVSSVTVVQPGLELYRTSQKQNFSK